ncbi:MAG: hypothetical protein JRF64_01005 [Deltaproteobacteria bacterium]|nr:hypothetical protein [Deltaproteobacteria bacterium]
MKTEDNARTHDPKSVELETCEHCGNVYRLIWLKEGDQYNDFGYRHCPFCGLLTDEYAHLAKG